MLFFFLNSNENVTFLYFFFIILEKGYVIELWSDFQEKKSSIETARDKSRRNKSIGLVFFRFLRHYSLDV
jgi:hypothetical protein